MRRIITYGTFDLLHWGHIQLLKSAKSLGDYLIVGLSTDEFNVLKGKQAYHCYQERKVMLESIRYVDLVIPESEWDQKPRDIQLYQADLFVMGDDWEGKFNELMEYCEVRYLPRSEGISTSKIKEDLEKYTIN